MNAELAQRRGQLLGTFDVKRLDQDGAIAKILFRDFQRHAEACQETADGAVECFRGPRNDILAIEQPLDRFLDLVGREALRKLAKDLRPRLAVLPDRGGEGAVEFAVQEEFAVLGIETNRARRQGIGREVRCKSQNVLAELPHNAGLAIDGHRVSTLILLPLR
ncbi:hypothetical protein [Bradyrhizobium liaoningense]|uniref:hypothetical protein n=1 Tax=Bradyrhizobium liaoningense TaxID=43992 RepID=UPI0020138C6E|nr:hypothetical protein [Bradyrhizobium liaoningense]